MSELSNLTGTPRTDVIPNYTLSPFSLADIGLIEEEFERHHVSIVEGSAAKLPPDRRRELLEVATSDVAGGRFAYGGKWFTARLMSARFLPFLLWVSLRHKHPSINQAEADRLITKDNESKVFLAILKLLGFATGSEGKSPNAGTGAAEGAGGPGGAAPTTETAEASLGAGSTADSSKQG